MLELACGKGEYTVNLARLFPDKNFVGIDYKGNRIWRGAKTVAGGRGKQRRLSYASKLKPYPIISRKAEVDEIWITFPDPQSQISREKKRLTSPRFWTNIKNDLKTGAASSI